MSTETVPFDVLVQELETARKQIAALELAIQNMLETSDYVQNLKRFEEYQRKVEARRTAKTEFQEDFEELSQEVIALAFQVYGSDKPLPLPFRKLMALAERQ